MKVINKLESYPTGDMIVPYCPNCDNPTYSERKCPFCNTELEYEEIIEKDKEIERLENIIKEVRKYIEHAQNYGREKIIYVNGNDILEILDKENKE